MVCGILGTESADAQGADPRTGDFLDRVVGLVKLHRAQARGAQRAGRGHRELQALKTCETHISRWKCSLRHKMDGTARLPARDSESITCCDKAGRRPRRGAVDVPVASESEHPDLWIVAASVRDDASDKTCWLTTGPKMVRKQADLDTKLKTTR